MDNAALFCLASNFINDGYYTLALAAVCMMLAWLNMFATGESQLFAKLALFLVFLIILANSLLFMLFPFFKSFGVSGIAMGFAGLSIAFLSLGIAQALDIKFNLAIEGVILLVIAYIPFIYGKAVLCLLAVAAGVSIIVHARLRKLKPSISSHSASFVSATLQSGTLLLDILFLLILMVSAFPKSIRSGST
ncbi:MAG: hypothetical protein ACP5LP_02575 [Candidatus Micrarchaeia archaeon]